MRMRYVLWDMDNSLTNDGWRAKFIDWSKPNTVERWHAYDSRMLEDKPAHLEVWKAMRQLGEPIFLTGRREQWRTLTETWIKAVLHESQPRVLMRANDDDSTSVNVKHGMLRTLLAAGVPLTEVIAAFDDMSDIVAMYRAYGLPAAVLRVTDPALLYRQAFDIG